MSLYIRLQNSYWEHRKTRKMVAALGPDGWWIMPRLWSFAASNQPDGNFSSYSAEEIALSVHFPGDAQAMLQAMLQACYMDEGQILHDWHEHNAYHAAFAAKAKAAASARWGKKSTPKRQDKKGKDKIRAKQCSKHASSISDKSLENITQYAIERGLPASEAQAFFDHHETRAWKLRGGIPVKDWKAAFRTWERNWRNGSFAPPSRQPVEPALTPAQKANLTITVKP